MTPPNVVFYLTCVLFLERAEMTRLKQPTTVHQERGVISANVGDNFTLRCFFDHDAAKYYWYKQNLGEKPQLMSVTYKLDKTGTFHDEFRDNPRFTLETRLGENHLKISDAKLSDAALYFCASGRSFVFEFGEGTRVSVQGSGSKIKASVHQSASETIQSGGSVTLSCTVHTGMCDGEHSVYWFRNSLTRIIYSHGGRKDQCVKKSDTQTHTCVYNLPMKSLNLSHAGTYYCAVVSCGRILFGNGTKLDFQGEVNSPVFVYFLSGALTFTTILSALLAFLLYWKIKRNSCQRTESRARFPAPSTTGAEGYEDADNIHYAALSVNLPYSSRRHRNTNNECLYSSIKL